MNDRELNPDVPELDEQFGELNEAWAHFSQLLETAEQARPSINVKELARRVRKDSGIAHRPVITARPPAQPVAAVASFAAVLLLTCNLVLPGQHRHHLPEPLVQAEASTVADWDDDFDASIAALEQRFQQLKRDWPDQGQDQVDSLRAKIRELQAELQHDTL